MWPPSPGTGIQRSRAWMRAPAPRPVPGPTTSRAPSGVVRPPPIWSRSSGFRSGRQSDWASKSLRRIASARPKRAISRFGSTTHGQLVSGTWSPVIGPASARIADFGRSALLRQHAGLDRRRRWSGSRRCAPSAGEACRLARRRSARSARWCRRCRRSAPGRGWSRGLHASGLSGTFRGRAYSLMYGLPSAAGGRALPISPATSTIVAM